MTLQAQLENFQNWLTRLNYATGTIISYTDNLQRFLTFLKKQKIHHLHQVTSIVLADYQAHLDRLPLSGSTLNKHISTLKTFDEYLKSYGYDPILSYHFQSYAADHFQAEILTQSEIKQVYAATDDTPKGYRDRAILALYYGCGLRGTEGRILQLKDISFTHSLLYVRKAKNGKARHVPMNAHVVADLEAYLTYARSYILAEENPYVLVHENGHYLHLFGLRRRVKRLVEQAHINKNIHLHSLRHSIATHLLENKMKLENISQFLGHSSLEITQRYTHLKHEYV